MIPTHRTLLACALGALLAMPAAAAFAQDVPEDQSDPQQTTDQDATTGSMQSDSNDWQQAGTPPQPTTPPTTDERTGDVDAMRSDNDFTRLDSDHDGRISETEAGADGDFNTRFAALDADGDGYVSQAEFDAGTRTQTPPPTP